ncbi:MAG: hypothetical protein RRC34_06735 [Lentisphaeria bacterium]|nr:hypothetical protein [Lentisphaeria bacterium]
MKPSLNKSIISPLHAFRRQVSRRRTLSVCCRAFAWVSAAVLVLQGISWRVPVRETMAAALVFSCLATGGGIWFLIWLRGLLRPLSMTRVARLVENGHPEFNDALICAAQLADKPPERLNPVEAALLHEVGGKLSGLNLSVGSITPAYTFRRLAMTGAAAVLLGVLAVRSPVFRKAVEACRAGSETGIAVEPGDVELAIGEDLVVKARIRRWRKTASIDVAGEKETTRHDMYPHGEDFVATFYAVDTPFSYRVVTPDVASPWYRADVYSPPGIAQVRCEVTPPAYTKAPAVVYEDLVDCSMLEGSSVTLSVWPTVPGGVWLADGGDAVRMGGATESGPESPAMITFTVEQEKSLHLFVQDTAGRKSRGRAAVFSVYPDAAPVVEVISPERETLLHPDEALFIHARAMDDFGLEEVTLHVSVAGRRSLSFDMYDGADDIDVRVQRQFTPASLDAAAGDVVAFFLTARDNKQPEGQIGRSDIRFVEIRADIKPRNAENGQPSTSVDVQRIIAELRRLITLTYELMTPSGLKTEKDRIALVTGLGDLRTLITRQMEEFRAASSAAEAAAMEAWYTRGGGHVEEARRLARLAEFPLSVKSQEKALSLFTKLAQELMKNQSSKPRDEPGEGQGSGSSAQKKASENQPLSLAEAMEILRKARGELSRLADAQAAQNQRLSRLRQPGKREMDELAQSQREWAEDTGRLREQLTEKEYFPDLTNQVGQAAAAMDVTADTLTNSDLESARREGHRARAELLAAIRQTESGLRQLAARQLSHLASQMNALATVQDKLAGLSREAGEKASVDKRTRDALRDAQKKIGDKAESVIRAARELSGELAESFPEAGESLRLSLTGKHAVDVEKTGRQAETALLYKRFGKATEYQNRMAGAMRSLSQEIAVTADTLPATSPAELMMVLNQLLQARAMIARGSPKERVQEQVAQTVERLAEMGRRMNDPGLMEVSGQLGEAVDRESGAGDFSETDRLLQAAGHLVKRHLNRSQVEEKAALTRKLARPPEKYRRQVEEYFKELSGD